MATANDTKTDEFQKKMYRIDYIPFNKHPAFGMITTFAVDIDVDTTNGYLKVFNPIEDNDMLLHKELELSFEKHSIQITIDIKGDWAI